MHIHLQDYDSSCNMEAPKRCELGDMSGKLGKLDIGTKANPSQYVFTDTFLSLTGQFSGKLDLHVYHCVTSPL